MIRFLVCACTVLVLWPSTALAQGEDSEWAAGSGGHFAFLAQDEANVSVAASGRLPMAWCPAPEIVSEPYAAPIVAVGPRGDVLVAWIGEDDEALHARYRPPGGVLGPDELVAPRKVEFGAEAVSARHRRGRQRNGHVVPGAAATNAAGCGCRTRSEAGVWGARRTWAATGSSPVAHGHRERQRASGVAAGEEPAKHPNLNQTAVSSRAPAGVFTAPRVLVGVNRDPGEATVAANDRGDAIVVWSQLRTSATTFRCGRRSATRAPGRPSRATEPVPRHGEPMGDGARRRGDGDGLDEQPHPPRRGAGAQRGGHARPAGRRSPRSRGQLGPVPAVPGAIAWADRDPA